MIFAVPLPYRKIGSTECCLAKKILIWDTVKRVCVEIQNSSKMYTELVMCGAILNKMY